MHDAVREPMTVAVVGAPGTGKSTLVHALHLALRADDKACTVVEKSALDQHHQYDLTLLMGLDLPQHCANTDPDLLRSDARLRQTLGSQSRAYAVVYGSAHARTHCALQAIAHHRRQSSKQPTADASKWHWNCETCSDTECEHRLFSALVKTCDSMRL
jgi:ABC-type glutathione transport system ATPase component